MGLEETEAGDYCAGEGQKQSNQLTSFESVIITP
jgi:hypothetical protein